MEGNEKTVSGVRDKVVGVKQQVPNIHENDSPDTWNFVDSLTLISPPTYILLSYMEEGIRLGAYPLITQKCQPLLIFCAEPRLWRTYLKRANFGVGV